MTHLLDIERARAERQAVERLARILRERPELQSERTKSYLGGGDMARERAAKLSEQIALRLPEDLLRRVRKLAERLGRVDPLGREVPVSDVLRQAIEIGVGRLEAKVRRK